eukprot:TRINITY_DN2538_c0_g1_i2.p1 TRINITY_DN2538_c0_g1~~TRINITY_DN2538_c0_g1_i2.p1  ORF type:complete len:143 (+),score=13.15 TRINITY_DN2538_c0_g1_i2:98-526(+)
MSFQKRYQSGLTWNSLHEACSKGDVDGVLHYLNGGVAENRKRSSRKMSGGANRSKRTAMLKTLDQNGNTPLYVASAYGHVEVVETLLEGTLRNIREMTNNRKRTALHVACIKGHLEIVEILLEGMKPSFREIQDWVSFYHFL